MSDDQGHPRRSPGARGLPSPSRAAASSRRIYGVYFLMLCAIAALVAVDTGLHRYMHAADHGVAQVIGSANDQTVRVQRIAALVTRLSAPGDPARRPALAAEVEETLAAFEEAHARMMGQAGAQAHEPSIMGAPSLEADIRSFIGQSRTLLQALTPADAVPSDADMGQRLALLHDRADTLDDGYEALLAGLAAESAGRLHTHEWVTLITGGLSILLLLGLGALVIRPLARRMEAFIREEAQARLFAEAVVDTIADGVITMDGQGRIRSFSRGAERIFGHASRDAVGRHVGILMREADARTHDGHVDRWRRTGEARVLGRPNDMLARRQSGETFPLQLTVTRTEMDGADLFVGICRDISVQRATERALRWSQRALDATPNLFMVVSREHRYVYSNRAHREATGFAADDIIGQHVSVVMGAEIYESLLRPVLDQALAGQLTCLDMAFEFPAGGRRVMSVTYMPLHEDDGDIDHVLVMALDVTNLTDQFRALERQRKALSLINAISSRHDADSAALLRDALEAVTRHLGMTVGIIGRAENDRCTILYQSGPADLSREGQSFPSGTAFPARTLETGDVLAFDRIDPPERTDHPFGPGFEQKACIGAPLVVNGAAFGAVSFLSESSRHPPFDEADRELVRLFGFWVQSQLERMQAQESLAQSEERLRRSLTFAEVGAWDWTIETGDLHWSDRIAPLFGGPEGELQTSYESFVKAVHPDDRDLVSAAVAACLENGAPYDIEHRVVWPDGTVRWLSEKGDAVRDADGRAIKMLGVVQDITPRKALEAQLRQFRHVVEETDLGVGIGTPDGFIVYVNAAHERIYAMSRTELIGRHFSTLHPDADPDDLARVSHAITHGGTWHGLLTARDGNGRSFPLNCSIGTLKDEFGKVVAAFNIMEDYSAEMERQRQLKDARIAAEAANKAKSEFLSQMSHELRTPLNAVIGFSQLLQMGKSTPLTDSQAQYVGHIRKSGEHLLALINDILDFAKADAGMLSLTLEAVGVAEVIGESLSLMEAIAIDREITIVVPDMPQDLCVRADHTRLTQVLVNLISNAIKYNTPGGSVRIEVHGPADGAGGRPNCRIAIHDTGIGMTEEQLGALFQPFNRLGAETLGIDGTGIGLVLSRQLIEAMGGTLSVESRPGAGSTFRVELAAEGAALPGGEAGAPGALPTTSGTGHPGADPTVLARVLYVADSPANRDLMTSYAAGRRDIRLQTVHTGELALDCARVDPPDVIVLDIPLSDLDGLTMLERLKRHPATAGIPVIALSADATVACIRQGRDAGFAAYLTKPVDFAALDRALTMARSGTEQDSGTRAD